MLLFSTILNVNDSLTKERFIALVEEWNETQSHPENRIPGLKWDGQPEYQCSHGMLALQIVDHSSCDVIAVRYQKQGTDGALWDTDYVFNTRERKIAIRLSREYRGDQPIEDRSFSAPHFITLLADKGYLAADGDLPVSREPIPLTEDLFPVLAQLTENKMRYRYPVVFVSRTHYDTDPLDVAKLAGMLKGIAHVLVQTSVSEALPLRAVCGGKEEYFGSVGVYLPNGGHQQRWYVGTGAYDEKLFEDIHHTVLEYANVQALPAMYTWQGVASDALKQSTTQQLDEARQKQAEAEEEQQKYIDTFDKDIDRLQKRISQLSKEIENKDRELALLQIRLSSGSRLPLLYMGSESDLYTDEIKEIVLAVLDAAAQNMDQATRRYHVISDIIAANNYQHTADTRREMLKNLLANDRSLTTKIRTGLEKLGFTITSDGEHHKLHYYDDPRYWGTLPKTASDNRSYRNSAGDIANKML